MHAQTHIYSAHDYTSSPLLSFRLSLSSMTHPTQGRRVRERESEGGREERERRRIGVGVGGGWGSVRADATVERKRLDSQRRHMAWSVFLLTFYFNAALIRSVCITVKVIPGNQAL